MRVTVKKWGNSYAIRIPKAIFDGASLENDSEVDISISNGKIVLDPVPTRIITLESLVSGITEENKHHEVDTGPAIGNEVE